MPNHQATISLIRISLVCLSNIGLREITVCSVFNLPFLPKLKSLDDNLDNSPEYGKKAAGNVIRLIQTAA